MVIREREGKRGAVQPKNRFKKVESEAGNEHLYRNGACLPQGCW